jgi:hypothetical protein
MKLTNKQLRDVRVGYLYDNGKLVLVHEESHKKAGQVEWVTIHDTGLRLDFEGRLIFHHRGTVRLLNIASTEHTAIRARAPSLEHGSENTKARGIAYGYVTVIVGPDQYHDSIHFSLSELVSGDFTLQPENKWVEPEGRWAGYPIVA